MRIAMYREGRYWHNCCRRDPCAVGSRCGAGKSLEARPDQRQGRRRHLPDGVDARLCQETGPQARNLAVQGRPARAEGADRRRARQLRRRAAGRVCRRCQGRRRKVARLPLDRGAARNLRQRKDCQGRGPQGQADRGVGARIPCPTCWRARRWRNSVSPTTT